MEGQSTIIKWIPLCPSVEIPQLAYEDDAGYDLKYFGLSEVVLEFGGPYNFPTGLCVQLPRGSVGLVCARSGLASTAGVGIIGGVIDSGYRGQIWVTLVSQDKDNPKRIEPGDKIAQMVVVKLHPDAYFEVPARRRNNRGFGSSGR